MASCLRPPLSPRPQCSSGPPIPYPVYSTSMTLLPKNPQVSVSRPTVLIYPLAGMMVALSSSILIKELLCSCCSLEEMLMQPHVPG